MYDAMALRHGDSRLLLQMEGKKNHGMPRPCAVEIHV